MNKLSTEKRVQVVAALVEGNSLRAVSRMTNTHRGAIMKLLVDLGSACAAYQDGYSVGQFIRTGWFSWLALATACLLTFFLVFPSFPICLGLALGAFFRDVGYYKSSRKVWPVTEQIVEWNRVNEMIESHEKGTV